MSFILNIKDEVISENTITFKKPFLKEFIESEKKF